MTFVSEAAELSRMNWWTAEYGLIGDLKNPQIFGAGLLSSVGESRSSLSDRVRKIPLSLDCIRQTYDITEPQPQLFVAKDFKHLSTVLEELAKTMAYRIGGTKALERAKAAASINTVELNNKIQISGVLKNFILNSEGLPIYLQFEGPTQLGFNNKEVTGHGTSYHQQGYGTPIGEIIRPQFSDFKIGEITEVVFRSGVTISGILSKIVTLGDGAAILSFENATCKNKNEILFLPDWGTFDIVTGISVSAAFGGPADRLAYGDFEDFIASKIVRPIHSEEQKRLFTYYQDVRNLRNSQQFSEEKLNELFHRFLDNAPTEWLLFLELSEMALKAGISPKNYEAQLSKLNPKDLISEGLKLAYAKY